MIPSIAASPPKRYGIGECHGDPGGVSTSITTPTATSGANVVVVEVLVVCKCKMVLILCVLIKVDLQYNWLMFWLVKTNTVDWVSLSHLSFCFISLCLLEWEFV